MDKLKWTKGVAGKLKPGIYLRRAHQGDFVDVFWSGEGNKQYVWYPTKDCFICGPLDIADPDPELELPEGWKAPLDGPPFVGDLWRIAARKGPEGQVSLAAVYVDHPDRARCVRAVNAAVKALEELRDAAASADAYREDDTFDERMRIAEGAEPRCLYFEAVGSETVEGIEISRFAVAVAPSIDRLGYIEWFEPTRRFVFSAMPNALLDAWLLDGIKTFMERATAIVINDFKQQAVAKTLEEDGR